jgi:hypothetical protein
MADKKKKAPVLAIAEWLKELMAPIQAYGGPDTININAQEQNPQNPGAPKPQRTSANPKSTPTPKPKPKTEK